MTRSWPRDAADNPIPASALPSDWQCRVGKYKSSMLAAAIRAAAKEAPR